MQMPCRYSSSGVLMLELRMRLSGGRLDGSLYGHICVLEWATPDREGGGASSARKGDRKKKEEKRNGCMEMKW